MEHLRITEATPKGWLYRQLQIQLEGLSGKLYDNWPDTSEFSAWMGGCGDGWERMPYYLDGLLPLSYYLEDERFMEICRRFVNIAIESQD